MRHLRNMVGILVSAPRWLEVETEKLSECYTEAQVWDTTNPRFDRSQVVDKVITITSARSRPSDHRETSYVVIGFTSGDLGNGQFKIGGHAASLPLQLSKTGELPVDLILRCKTTKSNRDFYKWEYPSCQI